MNVYVVIIEGHNFDSVPFVASSEAIAKQYVVSWVEEYWEDVMQPDERPEDPETMVAMYFEAQDGAESYTIYPCTIDK